MVRRSMYSHISLVKGGKRKAWSSVKIEYMDHQEATPAVEPVLTAIRVAWCIRDDDRQIEGSEENTLCPRLKGG